jgi:hypothetical protein
MKNISMLLVIVICAGILLAGPATAGAQQVCFFEMQASGKGVEVDSDQNLAFNGLAESRHTLDKTKLYAAYTRQTGSLIFLYYREETTDWGASCPYAVQETDKSLVLLIETRTPVSSGLLHGHPAPVFMQGVLMGKFKEKDDVVTKAQLKSLSALYFQEADKPVQGFTDRRGALKIKGKMIDESDVPDEVLAALP